MNLIEILMRLGNRIITAFGDMMNFMNTHGIEITGDFYSILDIIMGVGLPVLIIGIITAWVIDIFT